MKSIREPDFGSHYLKAETGRHFGIATAEEGLAAAISELSECSSKTLGSCHGLICVQDGKSDSLRLQKMMQNNGYWHASMTMR